MCLYIPSWFFYNRPTFGSPFLVHRKSKKVVLRLDFFIYNSTIKNTLLTQKVKLRINYSKNKNLKTLLFRYKLACCGILTFFKIKISICYFLQEKYNSILAVIPELKHMAQVSLSTVLHSSAVQYILYIQLQSNQKNSFFSSNNYQPFIWNIKHTF